jgi:hypothetical protein
MHFVNRVRYALALLAVLSLAGCPSKNSGGGTGKFMGTWQNTAEGMTIEIKADHKAVLRDKSGPTDATWEIAGAGGEEKLIVHGAMGIPLELLHNSDGTLRDTMSSSTWKKK